MKKRTFVVREIAYKKDSGFVAVSLDLDLVAEGNTIGEAIDRLREATIGYLAMSCKDNEPDSEIYRMAPKKYFGVYELLKELDGKKKKAGDLDGLAGKMSYDSSDLAAHA